MEVALLFNSANDKHIDEPRITERWFRCQLDLPKAEGRLYRVLDQLYPGAYIEGPRMRIPSGPFMGSWRRPDFGASLITGHMRPGKPWLPNDAQIEVRLYGEPNGTTTVLIGISVLGQNRPWTSEEKMLDEFTQLWQAGDPSLTQVTDPEYAI
jgi:hypothetical protein